MSIDALQEKIRKTKNPSVLYFDGVTDWIPPHIRVAEENVREYGLRYVGRPECKALSLN